jgi:uncharacterized membrane protein HdeD (DUF308 family)
MNIIVRCVIILLGILLIAAGIYLLYNPIHWLPQTPKNRFFIPAFIIALGAVWIVGAFKKNFKK